MWQDLSANLTSIRILLNGVVGIQYSMCDLICDVINYCV